MLGTIFVSALLAAAVAAIIFRLVKNKREGKGSCSCGCGCSACKKKCDN